MRLPLKTPDLKREKTLYKKGFSKVAGVDEAGRGPLAGPVVAAACILPMTQALSRLFPGLNDSKKLSSSQRETLYEKLLSHPEVLSGIGEASVEEIDSFNILQATLKAMQRAVEKLPVCPDYILVDGNVLPSWTAPSEALVKGDALSASIAAASILAKVTRDRQMRVHDAVWPQYGFAKNKGYGTRAHLFALQKFGRSPLHRASFSHSIPGESPLFQNLEHGIENSI